MKSLHDIPVLQNIPVLVRTAMNVPIENGVVTNDYRLRQALPTIQYLSERGARVVLISHIGEQGTETLRPITEALAQLISNVSFCDVTTGEKARKAVRDLSSGNILVLENLRRNIGETKNDPAFSAELAELADIFVQDSFDTCHRSHASIVGVPALLPSYAGLLLEQEVAELGNVVRPEHPSLAVIGGAKFSTKEPAIKALLGTYDHVFVGGALANDFLRAAGKEIGKSVISGAPLDVIETLLKNEKLSLPEDVIVAPKDVFGAPDARMHVRTSLIDSVRKDEIILDMGPTTAAVLSARVTNAKTVLWNGPLGNYEHGFTDATNALARATASSAAHTVIGGGDTIAAIETLGILHRFDFVSTGGGAMLDLLAYGTLPGISILSKDD